MECTSLATWMERLGPILAGNTAKLSIWVEKWRRGWKPWQTLESLGFVSSLNSFPTLILLINSWSRFFTRWLRITPWPFGRQYLLITSKLKFLLILIIIKKKEKFFYHKMRRNQNVSNINLNINRTLEVPPNVIAKDKRAEFNARFGKIVATHDMSKQCSNPMMYKLKGDELKAFVLTSSTFVSEGLVPASVTLKWSKYQRFFRAVTQSKQTSSGVAQADIEIRGFAKDVERDTRMGCTINLHLLAVELIPAVPLLGPISSQMALWIERFLLILVKKTKMKVSKNPDISMLKNYQVCTEKEEEKKKKKKKKLIIDDDDYCCDGKGGKKGRKLQIQNFPYCRSLKSSSSTMARFSLPGLLLLLLLHLLLLMVLNCSLSTPKNITCSPISMTSRKDSSSFWASNPTLDSIPKITIASIEYLLRCHFFFLFVWIILLSHQKQQIM